MLRIRTEQFDVFSKHMRQQFEDRMAVRLRSRFPDHTRPIEEPELRTFIRNGIERAATHNVTAEFDVQRYLEYMVKYGQEFDASPDMSWAGDILNREDLDGSEKMDRIDDRDLFA